LTILSIDKIKVSGIVSHIIPELCSGCYGCINVCPYGAISYNAEIKVAEVNPALCKGCGACAAAHVLQRPRFLRALIIISFMPRLRAHCLRKSHLKGEKGGKGKF